MTSLARREWLTLTCVLLVGCSVEILHDVDEATANEVLATLERRGVEGDKARTVQGSTSTYTVTVPRGEAAEAWKILRSENLPRPQQAGLGEVFGKTGLVPTATQERALMHHALSGELARTLQSVDGVLEARVHLVLPSRDPLSPPDTPVSRAKASVLLRLGGEAPLKREAIQRLVAGSVKDLEPERVSVVLVHASAGAPAAAAAPLRSVGPFTVAAGDRAALVATLVAGLVLVALLGAGVIVLVRRNRVLAARRKGERGETASRLEGSLGLIERSLASRSRSRATGEGRGSS